MSTYSSSPMEQLKPKQSVLMPEYQMNRNSQMYKCIDELPLPPPPPQVIQQSRGKQPYQHYQQAPQITDFPLPPPPEFQIADLSYEHGSSHLYANIAFPTHNHNRTNQPTESSPQPLYVNLSPRSIDRANQNKCHNSSFVKNNRNRFQSVPPTAIYANLIPNNQNAAPAVAASPFIAAANVASLAKPNSASIKNYLRVNRSSANKEEDEVDHLTNLLVKSMENSVEPDFFGMCNKCGEKVVGEGSGCTAMEMVYHIQCFTCHVCHKELRGKPFYAMESNPYCEDCYLNTLEKCSICEKPILDRILRATGKPYHPSCFTCVECKKCLDGIPFTVNSNNEIHCIDDFHKKFAPRCSVCTEPIIPEQGKTETVRVVALDRSFHVSCYKCEDCELLLSSEAEGKGCYPLDDHILCRDCNVKRVQEITAN